jgi:hypothetical protein
MGDICGGTNYELYENTDRECTYKQMCCRARQQYPASGNSPFGNSYFRTIRNSFPFSKFDPPKKQSG